MARKISVQLKIRSPGLAEEMKKIISPLDGFYLNPSKLLESGDLLIFEMGENLGDEIHILHSMSSSGRVKEIFAISPRLEPDLLIQVRRAGANRIFIQPFKRSEIIKALSEFKEGTGTVLPSLKYQKYGKMIYVLGCKGGVGTTSVALNLASGLAHLDKSLSVLLTDMTAPFGDLPVLLGINPFPDWAQLSKNLSHISVRMLRSILSKHPSGFYVLPSPSALEDERVNLEVVEEILSLMENAFEFSVIDGGKFSGEVSAKIFELADTILLLTNLTRPCLENLKGLLSFFQKSKPYPEGKIRIVVNRYEKNSSISLSLEEAEKELRKHIFWKIPNDFKAVTEAANQGKTLINLGEGKEICKSFLHLASFFLMKDRPVGKSNDFWNRLLDKSRWNRLALTIHLKPRPS
jgi:pilus assembly protein CpaE